MYRPMTRPRMVGSTASWTVEFALVLNVITAIPTGTSAAANSA